MSLIVSHLGISFGLGGKNIAAKILEDIGRPGEINKIHLNVDSFYIMEQISQNELKKMLLFS